MGYALEQAPSERSGYLNSGPSPHWDSLGDGVARRPVLAFVAPDTTTKKNAIVGSSVPFALLLILQALDGAFTLHGISLHGVEMEGNALVRYLMEIIGVLPALATVKSFAIIAVLFLWKSKAIVPWVTFSAKLLCVFYISTAILPWMYLFTVI